MKKVFWLTSTSKRHREAGKDMARSGKLWKHESVAARVQLSALKVLPPRHTVPLSKTGGAELFARYVFLRIARVPAEHVTDSNFVSWSGPSPNWEETPPRRSHIGVGGLLARCFA